MVCCVSSDEVIFVNKSYCTGEQSQNQEKRDHILKLVNDFLGQLFATKARINGSKKCENDYYLKITSIILQSVLLISNDSHKVQ